jgi:hypothetical protein
MNWTQRVQQLLTQLEERARQCPGLYPVRTSDDFKRIVSDFLERQNSASPSPEETANWLEQIWRQPELAYQLNAQSLIRREGSPFHQGSGDAPMENAAG